MFIFNIEDILGLLVLAFFIAPVYIWLKIGDFKTFLKQRKCKHESYEMKIRTGGGKAICKDCGKDLGVFWEVEEARKSAN